MAVLEETDGERRKNIKECIKIVLQKVFEVEQLSDFAKLLLKNGAISKSSHKKASKVIKNQDESNVEAISKIVNSLEQSKFEKFEDALDDKDYKGDLEVIDMIKTIFSSQTPHLFALIKHWDFLSDVDNQNEFKEMLGIETLADMEDDNNQVKKLIICVMDKLKEQDNEVVKLAIDFISEKSEQDKQEKDNVSTNGNQDNTTDAESKTRHEPSSSTSNRPVTHSQTQGDKSRQEQSSSTSNRPMTRSQTRENVADVNNPEKRNSYLRPVNGGGLWTESDSISVFIEFRAVLEEKNPLPKNTSLHIKLEGYKWKPIPMEYNESKKCYVYQCYCDKNIKHPLKYKYCFPKSDGDSTKLDLHHEKLPGESYDSGFVNRILNIHNVKTSWMVVLDVCLFDRTHSWAKKCCEAIEKLLPPLGITSNDKDQTSAVVDIFLWINCVMNGWHTDRYWSNNHIPETHDVEKILVRWLKSMREKMSNNYKDIIDQITATLSLVVALAYENYHAHCGQELLNLLFQMLNMEKLKSPRECKDLYTYIMKEYTTFENFELGLPTLRESIEWLYKQLQDPGKANMDWITTLPLYWLMVHSGELKGEVQSKKESTSFLYSRASLPVIKDFDWDDVYKNCRGHKAERPEFLRLSPEFVELSKLHPWIIKTFQFMLTNREFSSLIIRREECKIIELFPVDSILYQYLNGLERGHFGSLNTQDKESWEKYISDKIISVSSEQREDQQHAVTTCLNLLSFTIKFLGQDSKQIKNDEILKWLDIVVKNVVPWIKMLKKTDLKEVQDMLKRLISVITNGIHKKSVNRTQVEYWNKLLSYKWDVEWLEDTWKNQIINQISASIDNNFLGNQASTGKMDSEKFLEFYANDLENSLSQEDVAKIFDEKAHKCTEEWLKASSPVSIMNKIVDWFSGNDNSTPKMVKIFEKIFSKEYSKIKDTIKSEATLSIRFLIHWSFSDKFYEVFSQNSFKNFTSSTRKLIKKISDDFKKVVETLHAETISMEILELISKNKEKFFSLSIILKEKSSSSTDSVEQQLIDSVEMCERNLSIFKFTKSVISDFINVCDFVEFDEKMRKPYEELQYKLDEITGETKLNHLIEMDVDGNTTSYEYFGITQEEFEALTSVVSLKKSKVFKKTFKQSLARTMDGIGIELSWRDILEIWEDIQNQIVNFLRQLDKGNVTLEEILVRFEECGDQQKLIAAELKLLYNFCSKHLENRKDESGTLTQRELRQDQILNIFKSQESNSAVNVLLELKTMLGFEGNFDVLDDRRKMIQNQSEELLTDVPTAPSEILSFQQDQLDLLKMFIEAQNFVEWIQNNMTDIKELNTFCELGMISAGDSTIELDRISFMLAVVSAFAPLIFCKDSKVIEDGKQGSTELTKEHIGLKELLERCDQVWENSKSVENLAKKLEDTNEQLPWFKDLGKLHGSIEKLSLTRAQEINECGIYTIKYNKSLVIPTIEECLKLSVRPNPPGPAKLIYLEELKDLQSRLMLIAGEAEKGRSEVDRFVEVLTSVEKLVKVYVQLLKSGCMLFSNWTADIINGKVDTSKYLQIQIKFADGIPPICKNVDCYDLDDLNVIMTETLDKWNTYVVSKRMEYYHLNEFNIQQIIYLCRKLCLFKEIREVGDQAYMLLSLVQNNFTPKQLEKALETATEIYKELKSESAAAKEITEIADQSGTSGSSDSEFKHKLKLVEKLENQFGNDVAKAAVQSLGCVDIEDLEFWIIENINEDEIISNLSKSFDESTELLQEDKRELQTISSVLKPGDNTLLDVIKRLQVHDRSHDGSSILQIIKTICDSYLDEAVDITLQDYMSIEHLGLFLDNLYQNRGIARELLPGLQQGQPNILICNEDEIIPTILSLYMNNFDQPLPTRSEVVICSRETTIDEVERFLRRAMCNHKQKGQLLFTLAFADKLNWEVSTHLEKLFGELSSKRECINNAYQLLILLSKQKHYLATSFDKYLVDGKWSGETNQMQKYLEHHLTVTTGNGAADIVEENFLVKVVCSNRSGVGKSLHVKRLKERLENNTANEWYSTTIRLLEDKLSLEDVIEKLYRGYDGNPDIRNDDVILAHIDITPAVQRGIEELVFNFFVLGCIQDRRGKIWKANQNHFYVVEVTDFGSHGKKRFPIRHILNLLPGVKCLSPIEVYKDASENTENYIGMDEIEFLSENFQRPFQYLMKVDNNEDLDTFVYTQHTGNQKQCIEVLLRHCCMKNPSWAQLRHFCSFLNIQLENCEKSVFCTNPLFKPELDGLKLFAVKFMIKMAQDFATPSLKISDTSVSDDKYNENEEVLQNYQIRRKWEETYHPYLFFNDDRRTFTFINVKINDEGHLLDTTGEIIEHNIASQNLVRGIKLQQIDLETNFDDYPRQEKLLRMKRVLGLPHDDYDPDPTYELTTDNVLKILAIYMRFRCQIPVIIMGETGCGKTRLVEFMSKLKAGRPDQDEATEIRNMITLKIHGGITVSDIHESVEKAKETEILNREEHNLSTVLFYDEANTTEAIYAIKEVMCDHSISGKSFEDSNLCLVAACNPYKQLSDEAIKKLEDSGLGYRIHTSQTTHLFGDVPVRTLVYRVVALPPSMQPFVWDFGQLNDHAERIYIEQMTKKLANVLNLSQRGIRMINTVLSESQKFMREQVGECRYVSLRDVERCMTTYEWFYKHYDAIYEYIEKEVWDIYEKESEEVPEIDKEIRTLIQTVGVCYHTSLDERRPYRELLRRLLNIPDVDARYIALELRACQSVFLRRIRIEENIAQNEALRENAFMIAVCADMRIPLFLIGKPGSSKSLAKSIVANNMDGPSSSSPLYRKLKRIQIISFQCSALTDAAGIERVFFQAAQLQNKNNIDTFTAVVVLDEIGLAEDSPNMPLKVLHPLLERRSTALTTVSREEHQKVGFVGISNWALDPAKMNRGIFLMRNKPSNTDLKKTGKEIIQNRKLWKDNQDMFTTLTEAYLEFYRHQEREYFGLRDYYSLMKMLCTRKNCPNNCLEKDTRQNIICDDEVMYAILRNFSGGEKEFHHILIHKVLSQTEDADGNTNNVSVQRMICDNLMEEESRFLLLLANQYSVINLLEACIGSNFKDVHIVFGSSFRGDHSYTEICRNINRIKVCMETGKTVVLLNMSEIHESLYDTLNQHYSTFGGQNYVDLGLGGHKVKCRVSKKFRMIVIEKSDTVYKYYPIPLINRLEKHHFSSKSLLDTSAKKKVLEVTEWVDKFTEVENFLQRDAFVGFHDDTIGSIVLTKKSDVTNCKTILMQCCSVDAVLRLSDSKLSLTEIEQAQELYFKEQQHDRLSDVLHIYLKEHEIFQYLEIISYSGILSETDQKELEEQVWCKDMDVEIARWSLELFQTRQEYLDKLDKFFRKCNIEIIQSDEKKAFVLLIQCSQAQSNSSLIACAKHCILNKIREFNLVNFDGEGNVKVIVALLLSTERDKRGKHSNVLEPFLLQHTQESQIIYVDDLRPDKYIVPASKFFGKALRDVFELGKNALNDTNEFELIDIKALLNDSVCEAVAKVQSNTDDNRRYFERIRILKELFSKDEEACKHFRRIFLSNLVNLFDVSVGDQDWITREAKKMENLQEGGTFSKTLWLCLKRHTSNFLAHVISKVDRYNNLNVITNENVVTWKFNLWLGMFQDLEIPKLTNISVPKFTIHNPKHLKPGDSCLLPFSFEVIEFFQTAMQALDTKHYENMNRAIASVFKSTKTKTHTLFCQALEFSKLDVMRAFTHDLVMMLFVPALNEDDLIKDVVYDISLKKFQVEKEAKDFKDGDEIAVVFLTFKGLERKLDRFSKLLQICPTVWQNEDVWIKKQQESTEFILHIEAFKDVLEHLKSKSEQINKPAEWIAWMNAMRKVKLVYDSVTCEINDHEEQLKQLYFNYWLPLSLLDLFLLHTLPTFSNDESSPQYRVFRQYLEANIYSAKMFSKAIIKNDPRSFNFLRILTNILKMCCDRIELHILTRWTNSECGICGNKVTKPTFLPCNHFACDKCIEALLGSDNGRKSCPVCNEIIPNEFIPEVATLTRHQLSELHRFKLNCTIFFAKYLKQFNFKHQRSSAQMSPQIKLLLKEIVAQVDDGDKKELQTAGFDLNINMKANILRILYYHDPMLVEDEINQWLKKLDVNSRHNLITVILQYFEQVVMIAQQKNTKTCISQFWEDRLCKSWRSILKELENEDISFKSLKTIAEMRCSMNYFVSCLKEVNNYEADRFVEFGLRLFTGGNVPQIIQDYIIKVGCHKFGTQWLCKLAENVKFRALISRTLIQVAESPGVDFWSLLGDDYINAKSELFQSENEEYELKVARIFGNAGGTWLTKSLSIFCWLQGKSIEVRNQIMDAIEDHIGENVLTRSMEFLFSNLKENFSCQHQNHILYQLVFLVSAAASSQNDIMNGFRRLMTNPAHFENLYLPAMPEHLFFATPEEYRLANMQNLSMYRCPNGHLYSIGECTRPLQRALCPECKRPIGGVQHKPAEGNQKISLTPQSQAGYKRNVDDKMMSHGSDRLSPQGAAVVKFILHSCMLVGMQQDSGTLTRMLGFRDILQAINYLVQQLNENLEDLCQSLSRNLDDTVLILARIVLNIFNKSPSGYRERWSSLQERKVWEEKFRQEYMLPIFQNIEEELMAARNLMKQADDLGRAPLKRLLQDTSTSEEMKAAFHYDHCSLWNYIANPSLAHLLQNISDSSNPDLGKVLKILLQTPNLHLLRHLETILKLQQVMIERYQHKIDMKNSENTTFNDHITDAGSEDEKLIDKYILAWNMVIKVLPLLRQVTPEKLQKYMIELSKDSPISAALPSMRGRGQIAKLLTELLINIQNNFLSNCSSVAGTTRIIVEVEVPHLVSSEIICIDQTHDLMSMLHEYTNYHIETDGQEKHHRITYNIDAFEKQVQEEFVFCKKLIKKNTIPYMKYPQDSGIGPDWQKVFDSINQELLTAKLIQDVDRQAERCLLSEICEGVRTLTMAISFLAMVKSDPSKILCEFLEKDLQLSPIKASTIPKSARLKHVLAIYQRLSWHKAVKFVQQGLDPYKEALSDIDQEDIPIPMDITEMLDRTDVVKLQQRINEMLINLQELQVDWSLVEDVFPNLAFLEEDDDDSWYCNLPVELCCKHISDLFSYSVHHHFDKYE